MSHEFRSYFFLTFVFACLISSTALRTSFDFFGIHGIMKHSIVPKVNVMNVIDVYTQCTYCTLPVGSVSSTVCQNSAATGGHAVNYHGHTEHLVFWSFDYSEFCPENQKLRAFSV